MLIYFYIYEASRVTQYSVHDAIPRQAIVS